MSQTIAKTPVLVLNNSFEPINICGAKRALSLVVKGTALAVVDRDRLARPGVPVPSVIRLTEYTHVPHRMYPVTRKGIFLRDRNTCQYCGKALRGTDATLDHVLPQSRGGRDIWENLVACCKACNRFKGAQTPSEAGMTLARKPRPVSVHTSRHLMREAGAEEESWRKYLYYDSAA